MPDVAWTLRPARADDRDFLYALNESTMRRHIEAVWGWDDAGQAAFFDERFAPDAWQVVQIADEDVGVLIVNETADELYLAEIQLAPAWQGRGVGSSIIRSLMCHGKPLTLRVLHVNGRARTLYERLGFRPFEETDTHTYLRWEG